MISRNTLWTLWTIGTALFAEILLTRPCAGAEVGAGAGASAGVTNEPITTQRVVKPRIRPTPVAARKSRRSPAHPPQPTATAAPRPQP